MNLFRLAFLSALLTATGCAHTEDRAPEVPAATPAVAPDITAPLLDVSSAVLISSPLTSAPVAAPVMLEAYRCPLARCVVVSKYGTRTVPGKTITERNEGIGIRVTPGQSVRAARSGKVLFAGFSKAYVSRADKRDQQRLIIIQNADKTSCRYVHLNTLAVRSQQTVKAGDVIGTASESDEWTEPVLHFEIRAANGAPVNPEKFLKADKK